MVAAGRAILHGCEQASLVVVHGLSRRVACGVLVPRPGIEPVPSALAGGLLTNGPPGKSLQHIFLNILL